MDTQSLYSVVLASPRCVIIRDRVYTQLTKAQDLDVLVREDCTPILLRSSQFSQTAGNRLIYRKDGTDVFIDIMWPQNTHHREFLWIWDFSWPSTSMEEYEKINTKGGFLGE